MTYSHYRPRALAQIRRNTPTFHLLVVTPIGRSSILIRFNISTARYTGVSGAITADASDIVSIFRAMRPESNGQRRRLWATSIQIRSSKDRRTVVFFPEMDIRDSLLFLVIDISLHQRSDRVQSCCDVLMRFILRVLTLD